VCGRCRTPGQPANRCTACAPGSPLRDEVGDAIIAALVVKTRNTRGLQLVTPTYPPRLVTAVLMDLQYAGLVKSRQRRLSSGVVRVLWSLTDAGLARADQHTQIPPPSLDVA
jgi:hypothetical protein